MIHHIEIFDPDIQCYAGECEPMGNKEYMRITSMVENLQMAEKDIVRFNPKQCRELYRDDPEIQALIDQKDVSALPAVRIDGKFVLNGRYPTNAELLEWEGISQDELVTAIMQKKISKCKCGNDTDCCC